MVWVNCTVLDPMITAARYRKIALSSQGLTHTRPFGTGMSAISEAIEHLGYVQIDTISVVQRAHHHVLWSRVPDYRLESLDTLIQRKEIFEYWFHAAAYLPMQHYRFALPRMEAIKSGKKHWFTDTDRKLMKKIYRRIEAEGPLMARDFQDGVKRKGGWWEWKPAKQALEQLFMEGDLMVVGRQGFQKRYDIAQRVLPSDVDSSLPSLTEQAQHLIDLTLRAHGFAESRSFTYLRRDSTLRSEVKRCLQHGVEEGQLIADTLPAGEEIYLRPSTLEKSYRADRKVRLLSPFDNCVIQRGRCRSVFNFGFQIECYVPAAKRQHGYFCLPILYRDKFVGRADCKADRKAKVLRVMLLDLESDLCTHQKSRKIRDTETNVEFEFLQQLANALRLFRAFNQCDTLNLEIIRPKSLRAPLLSLLGEN